MLFSPCSENPANIIEDRAKRQGIKVGQAFLPVQRFGRSLIKENGQAGMPVLQHPSELFEIGYKATMFEAAGFVIGRTEN